MTDITFYHLTETGLDEALPSLVRKALERKLVVSVKAPDEATRDALDDRLWTFEADSFLPHGRDGDEPESEHPVFLTVTDANPNNSAMRFVIAGADLPPDLATYQRVALMFDGKSPDAVERARAEWKRLKGEGFTPVYWRQSEGGRWEKAG